MEQDSLVTLREALEAPVVFTVEAESAVPEMLITIFGEYKKTPLVLHVVWRRRNAPATAELAQFGGKKVKQYWDPESKTPSTGGRLRINGKLIELERLALRMGLARAAAFPQ